MKRLLIGLDIDGVIVDATGAILPFLSEACSRPVSREDITSYSIADALNMDGEKVHELWQRTIESGRLQRAAPIDGALAGLSAISHHEIWIVTGRPSSLQEMTLSWFDANNVHYDTMVFDKRGIKNTAGPEFDVFVDDFIDEVAAVAGSGIPALLFDQPWNQSESLPANCRRVYDWDAVVGAVRKLEAGP